VDGVAKDVKKDEVKEVYKYKFSFNAVLQGPTNLDKKRRQTV